MYKIVKLNKNGISSILWLVSILSLFALGITIRFLFDSLLLSKLVWLIVFDSLLVICSSISGTIIYTTIESNREFEIPAGLLLIFAFSII